MQQSYKLLAISHWLLDTRITEETLPHVPISPYFPSVSPYFFADSDIRSEIWQG